MEVEEERKKYILEIQTSASSMTTVDRKRKRADSEHHAWFTHRDGPLETISPTRRGFLDNINCSGNELVALPESLSLFTSLTYLSCSFNKLVALPESLGSLTSLTELHCSYNKLVALPESLGKLTSLTKLRCYHNKLVTLPESLGSLASLTQLHCYHNRLVALPESLGALTSLTYLNCFDNKLVALPESLGELESLNYVLKNTNQFEPKFRGPWTEVRARMRRSARVRLLLIGSYDPGSPFSLLPRDMIGEIGRRL